MEIALLSPLPPQQSGIADYVFHLLKGLIKSENINVTLFSNGNIDNLLNCKVIHIDTLVKNQLNDYDLIIYQLGNNIHYHQYMLDLLKQYGGIVHLHDLVLHHMIAGMNYNADDEQMGEAYFDLIENHYGKANKIYIENKLTEGIAVWESKEVVDFPLFEEFVHYADSCIVHSNYALNRVKAVFPHLSIYHIQQLYDLEPFIKKTKDSSCLRIGVFGGVDLQKKVEIVIEVLAKIQALNQPMDFRLDVVGAVNETCESIFALPMELGLEDKVFIHGRVDEAYYNKLLNQTDVIVALRIPTMGETSAVVMQGLQLGIPVIVNNVGWYHELPEVVDKVSAVQLKQGLQALLLKYLETDYLQIKTQAIRDYALEHFNFDAYVTYYQEILTHEYHCQLNKPLYPRLTKVFKDLDIIDDDILLKGCLERLEGIF
ncbi:MAG: glycosyltransferase [Methylococcales bacterium]|nr:glycosyltransferase [Methylococcales bacterium]